MTDEQLREIEQRANVATLGPWVFVPHFNCVWHESSAGAGHICDVPDGDERDNDMNFIAAARSDVPALIAEVRRLRIYEESFHITNEMILDAGRRIGMPDAETTPDALADEILELRVKLAAMSAFAGFGKDVMEWILDNPAWWGDESSEEIMPIAEKYRLAECVAYDPEIHGYEIYADEGDEIWWIDSNKWPAANDEIVKLRADIERLGAERDQMVAANVELQERLSAMEDDGK